MNRRFRILVFAVIMGFLVFSMLFQMMFKVQQNKRSSVHLPGAEQEAR
ncbi:hypothetical protein [Vampirovibrio sp.]